MTIYVTDDFKRHVPDWERHVRGDILWTEYGEGWLDGYECGEREQAGLARDINDGVGVLKMLLETVQCSPSVSLSIRSVIKRIETQLAALAPKEPAP